MQRRRLMQRHRRSVFAIPILAFAVIMHGHAPSATAQTVPPTAGAPYPSTTSTVEPGYLGVLADENGSGQTGGIRLLDVVAGGPAQAAGLRSGDVITSIDGQAVKSVDDMGNLLAGKPAGAEVTVVIRRGDNVQRVELRLTKRPPPEQRRFGTFGRLTPGGTTPPMTATTTPSIPHPGSYVPPTVPGPSTPSTSGFPLNPNTRPGATEPLPIPGTSPLAAVPPSKALLGVRAVPVVPELQRSLNLPDARGALIVEVQPGSPAQKAGLPLEAVVVGIDGLPIASPQELAEAVSERGAGTDVRLSYFRFGQLTEKVIRLGVGPSPVAANPPMVLAPPPSVLTPPPTNSSPLRPVAPSNALPQPVPIAPLPAALPPSKDDKPVVTKPAESEADKLRRQIREMEARLAEIEKQKSANPAETKPAETKPPAKKP